MAETHKIGLISVTPNAENTILYIARVSSDQSNDSPGLLKYLIRNKHWSPFEVAHMTLEIITSRAISQQILRHKSFSFQEFSQRYASPNQTIKYTARTQAETNRQSSAEDVGTETQRWWTIAQEQAEDITFGLYEQALEKGIARECARFILPESTETKLYMSGSLRSWIHFFELRCDEHTQQEHREIALDARKIFSEQFPIISGALGWELGN
jgi:thymidylate synthase (FAD)